MRLRQCVDEGTRLDAPARRKGFVYIDEDGDRIDDDAEIERIKALVIPPAWNDVWICTVANGHLQCVGTDAAGRTSVPLPPRLAPPPRRGKFDRVLRLAKRLPKVRDRVLEDLATARISTATGCSPLRCVCSTSAISGSATTCTPMSTGATA